MAPSALVLEEVGKSTTKSVSLEEAQNELAMPNSVVPLELDQLGRVPLENLPPD